MASDSGADAFVSKRVVFEALVPAIRALNTHGKEKDYRDLTIPALARAVNWYRRSRTNRYRGAPHTT
jgi:hypothetical protein